MRYEAGIVDAALGHRGFVLTVVNCGDRPRRVAGYPDVHVLDGRNQVTDVRVENGTSYMGIDPGPKTFDLRPGRSLVAVVASSATVTSGDLTTGSAISVASAPGETPRALPVETDLGTTGTITVTAWDTELAR
ncbi:DUF4232 domain-containing protein [Amycolatopsis thermophila]|uniref:DUF4232 domain-containing protein n=1 Tax=Amycolatopsis thermophila TaxID=206084 RepID=A0ABU0EYZ9_9PSEU|nr:DUF4232 domain-containing protein [Amycolatopsis thermophila]MDQ0380532.1 hypothetical protein [Amycolatopsis thermophila]